MAMRGTMHTRRHRAAPEAAWRRTPAGGPRLLAACALTVGAGAGSAQIAPQQEATMSDRDPLAQLVEPINAEVARLIRDPASTVQRLDTPFLRHGLIFRIDWY